MPRTDGKDVPGFYYYLDSSNAVTDYCKKVKTHLSAEAAKPLVSF